MTEIVQFTLTSYNIRKAIGRDGKRLPERIFDVLNEGPADIVVLQEADFRFRGRKAIFSESELLDRTGLTVVDVAPDAPGLGWHGNMLLLRAAHRMTSVHPISLTGLDPRGAVVSRLEVGGKSLALVQAHLGLVPYQRRRQAEQLVAGIDFDAPTLFAGDFNAIGRAPGSLSAISNVMQDTHTEPSFPTRWPCVRFDRIFHNQGLQLLNAGTHDTPLARVASDHLPVTATFKFN